MLVPVTSTWFASRTWTAGDRDVRSCHALLREWLAGGRRFVALQEKLDLERLWDGSSPMVLALLAAAAEFELRANQRRRIRRRAAQRRRAAKPVNRARLWQLHLSGASVREMAAELGQSRSTVHRTLQSMRSSLR